MGKNLEIDLEDEALLCNLGVALSSPVRVQILKLLYFNSFNVGEIAKKLEIPASSAALYIRSLETAGLINTQVKKGSRGAMKICSRRYDMIHLRLSADDPDVEQVSTVSMPVGHYTDCRVFPSCGLASVDAPIGYDDHPDTSQNPAIVRIGNKEDAEFAGGFNLHGAHFGDYAQDIVLSFILF